MNLPRILVADDDDSVRSLLRLTLPAGGVEVVEARDGEEALELISSHAPDLLLLDWKMPGRSGADVLAEVRRSHPTLPVIVLTADQAESTHALAGALGADTFLTKPFSPVELLEAVESFLPELAGDQSLTDAE